MQHEISAQRWCIALKYAVYRQDLRNIDVFAGHKFDSVFFDDLYNRTNFFLINQNA